MDPRRLLPVLLVIAAVCVVTTLCVVALRPDGDAIAGAHPANAEPSSVDPSRSPAAVLAAWDRQRSQAWARGDVRALADLYLPRSRAGSADVGMLRGWTSRGLRVVGLQTQVLDLAVTARSGTRLDLVVTDRMVGAEAVGEGRRFRLPVDRASTRRIVLRKAAGRWLVAEVRDQASAAARTSSTSSSSES